MLNKFSLLLLVATLPFIAKSQSEELDHDCDHQHHKHEIGMANSPTYYVKEKEFTYGMHFHYTYTLGESKFGIGLGYEQIFDEHEHKTAGIVFSYRPFERLSLNVSPGLTSEAAEDHLLFALHLESSYEFEIGNFHIGPLIEIAYDPEDYHTSLGLHVGYGF